MRLGRTVWGGAIALLLGCGPADVGDDEAQAASDSFEGAVAESVVALPAFEAMGGLSPTMPVGSVDEAVARAAERAPRLFSPDGCATATASGTTLTLALNECVTGSGLGRAQGPVSGTLRYTYSFRVGMGLQATVESTDLRTPRMVFRNVSIDLALSYRLGRLRADVSSRAVANFVPRNIDVRRTGAYAVVWESATRCFGVDGRWMLPGGVSLVVSRYQRCGARCPEPGGQVTYTSPTSSVVMDFVGGRTARWQSGSLTGTVAQRCDE